MARADHPDGPPSPIGQNDVRDLRHSLCVDTLIRWPAIVLRPIPPTSCSASVPRYGDSTRQHAVENRRETAARHLRGMLPIGLLALACPVPWAIINAGAPVATVAAGARTASDDLIGLQKTSSSLDCKHRDYCRDSTI